MASTSCNVSGFSTSPPRTVKAFLGTPKMLGDGQEVVGVAATRAAKTERRRTSKRRIMMGTVKKNVMVRFGMSASLKIASATCWKRSEGQTPSVGIQKNHRNIMTFSKLHPPRSKIALCCLLDTSELNELSRSGLTTTRMLPKTPRSEAIETQHTNLITFQSHTQNSFIRCCYLDSFP